MFSWTDYFKTENNEDDNIKVLKKSNLCQKLHESVYSNDNCDEKRKMYVQKKLIKKTHIQNQSLTDNKQKHCKEKSCSKILDLSPEEKEKIAALIRELGVLQSEKEKVCQELNVERNKFQLELTSLERMYKATLEDKMKLEDELQKKVNALKIVQMEELKKSKINRETINTNEESLIIQRKPSNDSECSSPVYNRKESCFPGPPKSSRSQLMTSDLLRTYSLQSVDHGYNIGRHSLIEEQNELIIEKQYLNLVLKQQKCLSKLKKKITKLEHREKHTKVKKESLVNNSERSSMVTDSDDLITPRTLNDRSLDDDSISQSVSVSNVSICAPVSPIQPPLDRQDRNNSPDSILLKNDDVLIISALNHGIKDVHHTGSSYLRPQSGLSSVRTHSPSESLFQMIDTIDDLHLSHHDYIHLKSSSVVGCLDDDILSDLFFNN